MDTLSIVIAIIVAMGVPTSVTALGLWFLQKNITKTEKKREAHEKKKERCEVLLIQLGEACAIALKNGKTNGETERALKYAQQVKHAQIVKPSYRSTGGLSGGLF